MKKRSLSPFAYYAANRAFPVFLLLLLLLGFTACSAEKGAKALDYPAMFGETKNEVLAALDEENLTYKEDDLYANAYVLDQIETLENRDFSVYLLFDLNTDTLYGYRRILFVENPTDADCKLPEKLLNTLTAQYGEPTTYPGLENRISTHLDRLSTDAVRFRRGLQRILVGVRKLRRVTRRQLSPRRPPFCRHRLPNPANVILVKLQKDSFPGSRPFFILILSQTLSRISVIRFQ